MDYSYEANIVREFGKFIGSGIVYKGRKPIHWCPTCVTALAEAEVEYADHESPSVYVKFRLKDQLPFSIQRSEFSVYLIIGQLRHGHFRQTSPSVFTLIMIM